MRKVILFLTVVSIAVSCANKGNKSAVSENKTANTDPTNHPDYQKGFDLVGNSDCFTCHKVGDKLVGPAYTEVAKKYSGQEGAVDTLARSIIHGSIGKWGQVQMIPHANLSEEDAKAMAKYILTLNQ
jgi:cytochrome c